MPKNPLTDLLTYAGAFLTVRQLAEYWGVSRKHILKLIETNCLESIRFGPKTYRVRVHAAIEFERQNAQRGAGSETPSGAPRSTGQGTVQQTTRAAQAVDDRASHRPHSAAHPVGGTAVREGPSQDARRGAKRFLSS
jgi:excisionase family DNA binding protein